MLTTILHDLKRIAELKRAHAELDKQIVAALDKVYGDILAYENGGENEGKTVERTVLDVANAHGHHLRRVPAGEDRGNSVPPGSPVSS